MEILEKNQDFLSSQIQDIYLCKPTYMETETN